MLGLGLGVDKIRPSGRFDADYQAVLNYATTQGYTLPSSGQRTLQNQLVVDLKAAGVWAKLDAFSVFATDGDADFALIDWVRLITQTAVNSPTFTTNQGYQGDGVSAYIRTSIDLTSLTNYSLNDASVFFKLGTADSGVNGFYNGAEDANQTIVRRGLFDVNGTSPNFMSPPPSGSLVHLLTDGTTLRRYLNGVNDDNLSRTPTGIPAIEPYILSSNQSGSSVIPTDGQIAVHGYGGNLEVNDADLNTVINTYISSL